MNCPECGTVAAETAKFCSECGIRLPVPGAVAVPLVPERLAERMRADAARMAGERKVVTVVFADIAGSMDLAEHVDPERWREIMAGLSERLGAAIHRFEGTIDKFTGDGIMALFGAPIAHEDHARRGCLAALGMLEAVRSYADEVRRSDGISLALRVGINSGEVVVGGIGEDLGLDYTAIGHTVGLAQRMEGLAEPGSAYATESTARFAEGLVSFDELGEFGVKGSQRKIEVFRVAGEGPALGRFDVARRRGLSHFVGREAEMEQLEAALDAAVEGRGQVIGIVAQAGTGKSRICHELRQLCLARGIGVFGTECQAHASNIPLLPVLRMLRSYFGIEPGDAPQLAREKAAGRLLLLDRSFEDDLPVLFDFLSIPDPARPVSALSSEARKQRLLALVSRVMAVRSEVEAAVNIIEDLHWIDSASEEFLQGLIDATAESRTLTVVNYRREYEADWMDREWCSEIRLEPLGDAAVSKLLEALLGSHPSLDGLAERVIERTGGNPFYVEETVRSLAESGALDGDRGAYRLATEVSAIDVPPTVQAILAARIDRLGSYAKRVMHTAAVIGGRFRTVLLARTEGLNRVELDAALAELVRAEFIEPFAPDAAAETGFVHPLTLEVAYGEQLAPERRRRHAAIAVAMAEVDAEHLDERAAEIAHHHEQAGEALAAARWHARAAEWLRTTNVGAASAHLRRIRALGPDLPRTEEADRLRLLAAAGLLQSSWRAGTPDFEELAGAYEEAVGLAEKLEDWLFAAIAHSGYGITQGICRGRVAEFYEYSQKAIECIDRAAVADPAMRVISLLSRPYPAFLSARYEESLEALDEVIRLTADDVDLGGGIYIQHPRSFAVAFRALPLMGLGRFDEALAAALEGIALGARHDRETLAWSHTFAASVHAWGGRRKYEEGIRHAEAAIEIGHEMGHAQSQMTARAFLGILMGRSGQFEEATQRLLDARQAIRTEHVSVEFEPLIAAGLANAYLRMDRVDDARTEAEDAYRMVGDRQATSYLVMVAAQLAEVLLVDGGESDLTRAEDVLAEAEQAIGGRTTGFGGSRLLRARALLCGSRGDDAAKADLFDQALALAREMNAEGTIDELEAELAAS